MRAYGNGCFVLFGWAICNIQKGFCDHAMNNFPVVVQSQSLMVVHNNCCRYVGRQKKNLLGFSILNNEALLHVSDLRDTSKRAKARCCSLLNIY